MNNLPLECGLIEGQPGYNAAALRLLYAGRGKGATVFGVLHLHLITGLKHHGWNTGLAAINENVTMLNKLASRTTRWGKAKAINEVVHTHLKHLEKLFTGDAAGAQGTLEEKAELPLLHAIGAAELLFLTKLNPVIGKLASALAMHSGRGMPLLNRAFGHVTPLALEEQLGSFSAALLACGTCIPTHKFLVAPE